ncbi:MerC mercury resistance protein [compost metagenome]
MYLLALGFVGLSLVGGAPLVHDFFHVELFREDLMTIFGSSILIGAHLLNRRACQCDDHTH